MNGKRSAMLILLSLAAGYLLGFYQVTPAYLYSLRAQPGQIPTTTKTPAQAKGRSLAPNYAPATSAASAEAQPTPWPAPERWTQR